jgi:uncharacterized GH25 family protein
VRPGRRIPLAVAALVLTASRALAHDFWIEPSTFRPAVGSEVAIALRVGENFRGDPVARADDRILRFVLRSDSGESPIPGADGSAPAGLARITAPGLNIVGYRSRNARVDLPADKFEQYLREEGLENAIALRASRGETDRPSRERYSRCVKSLLSAGGSAAGEDRPLGLTLEIVAARNPYGMKPGKEMPFRVLLRGKPVAGVLVVALPHDAPEEKISARSDPLGRVSFRLSRPGVWLVKAVHIEPTPAGEDADWESLWASSTFELPSGGSERPGR